MNSITAVFKNKGLPEAISLVELTVASLQERVVAAETKVRELTAILELSSAVMVESGSSIMPIEKFETYQWIASDITDAVRGLDAITYDNEKNPVRWAAEKTKEVKFFLPLLREETQTLYVHFSSQVNQSVLASIQIHVDNRRYSTALRKHGAFYTQEIRLPVSTQSSYTFVRVCFEEFQEGSAHHTLGMCGLEVK